MRIPSHAAFGMSLRHPAACVCVREREYVCMRMYIHMHVSALVHTCVFKNMCVV